MLVKSQNCAGEKKCPGYRNAQQREFVLYSSISFSSYIVPSISLVSQRRKVVAEDRCIIRRRWLPVWRSEPDMLPNIAGFKNALNQIPHNLLNYTLHLYGMKKSTDCQRWHYRQKGIYQANQIVPEQICNAALKTSQGHDYSQNLFLYYQRARLKKG